MRLRTSFKSSAWQYPFSCIPSLKNWTYTSACASDTGQASLSSYNVRTPYPIFRFASNGLHWHSGLSCSTMRISSPLLLKLSSLVASALDFSMTYLSWCPFWAIAFALGCSYNICYHLARFSLRSYAIFPMKLY